MRAQSLHEDPPLSQQEDQLAPEQQLDRLASRRFKTLFWLVVGIPLAAIVLAFPLVSSPWFIAYADKYGPIAQRPLYTASGVTCDILMTGDSTSLVGLDPRVIQGVTHLTACNIGATGPGLAVNGLAPLDRYLERNPRPKLLILQFSGLALHEWPTQNSRDINIEGILPMMRYVSLRKALGVMARNPETLIGLVHYTYVQGALDLRSRFVKHEYAHALKGLGGYTVMPFPPLKACPDYAPTPIGPENLAWIHFLRDHYASKADHVLVDVAPTSLCNPSYLEWQEALSGQIDNHIDVYPFSDFVDSYSHLTRNGALRFSNETAQNIQAYLQQLSSSRKSTIR